MNPALLGLAAALAWGTLDFAARFVSRSTGHHVATLGVTVAGTFWLSAWVWFSDLQGSPGLAHLWLLALTGVGITLATLWLFAALAIGPVAVAAPIVSAYPLYAVLIALAMGARPDGLQWVAMAAVIVGVVMIARFGAAPPGAGGVAPDRGLRRPVFVYALLSGVAFAFSITAGQRAAVHFGELQATLYSRLFGLAAIATIVLWRRDPVSASVQWWPLLAVMGALDAMAIGAVLGAGKYPGAEIATVASSAFGVVTVLLARVFLRERISPLQWLGIAFVFAGSAVLSSFH